MTLIGEGTPLLLIGGAKLERRHLCYLIRGIMSLLPH